MSMSKALQRIAGWFGGDLGIELGTTNTLSYAQAKASSGQNPPLLRWTGERTASSPLVLLRR